MLIQPKLSRIILIAGVTIPIEEEDMDVGVGAGVGNGVEEEILRGLPDHLKEIIMLKL